MKISDKDETIYNVSSIKRISLSCRFFTKFQFLIFLNKNIKILMIFKLKVIENKKLFFNYT